MSQSTEKPQQKSKIFSINALTKQFSFLSRAIAIIS